jgi:hypothetical protein
MALGRHIACKETLRAATEEIDDWSAEQSYVHCDGRYEGELWIGE